MPAIISEIRYRNGPGFSPDSDFVEIRVPTGTSVSGLTVEVYNPNGTLRSATSVDSGSMTTVGNFDYYVINARINRFGAVSLDDNGTVLGFVSFDGDVTATEGAADGLTADRIGDDSNPDLTDSTESVTSTDGTNFVVNPTPSPGAPCFTTGTLIQTATGKIAVEDLKPGDRVLTSDGEYHPLRLNLSRALRQSQLINRPELRPVRILSGALGQGLPTRDLLVSRQHRMLVHSPIARRMFGTQDVLVSAIRLTDLPGIFVDDSVAGVTYHHLVFDRHVVLFAEDAPSESLFTGPQALRTIPPDARDELFHLFPQLGSGNAPTVRPACFIPSGKQQRKLVARHISNKKPLLVPDAATNGNLV